MHSIRYKGWRAMVYEIATRNFGLYHSDRSQTIFYREDGTLIFNIVFKTEDYAVHFINELLLSAMRFSMLDMVSISQDVDRIDKPENPTWILINHYNTEASTSPPFSLNGSSQHTPTDTASVHSDRDPTSFFLMVEDPRRFVGLEVYDCHLMSKKDYPAEKDNVNNILKLSWALHQRFDGLKTNGPRQYPQIAISFIQSEGLQDIQTRSGNVYQRYKVIIAIEAQDNEILAAVGRDLKTGSHLDLESNTWRVPIFVENDEDFERCLMVKYVETKRIWGSPVA